MMKKNDYEFAMDSLNSGKAVVIGTIIRQFGSSPRGPGAKIIINAEGKSAGTVGGGKQESEIYTLMSSIIAGGKAKVVDIEYPEVVESIPDLRCGGNVSILLEPVYPQDILLTSILIDTVEMVQLNQAGWMLSRVPTDQNEFLPTAKCLIRSDGHISGNLAPNVNFKNHLINKISFGIDSVEWNENPNLVKVAHEIKIGKQTYFIEPVGQFSVVYIVGTGHVAQKLAILTNFAGFRTVIIDDRCDYLNESFFPNTNERIQVSDFRQVFDHMIIDQDSFIISMTRAHLLDQKVISQALKTDAGFIGMIGSRKKTETILSMLENEGYPQKDLERVHSPIGIPIGAETPEEIAISIMAEIIKVRASFNNIGN
jgi:xanthine dehydrogenase accessory factor